MCVVPYISNKISLTQFSVLPLNLQCYSKTCCFVSIFFRKQDMEIPKKVGKQNISTTSNERSTHSQSDLLVNVNVFKGFQEVLMSLHVKYIIKTKQTNRSLFPLTNQMMLHSSNVISNTIFVRIYT